MTSDPMIFSRAYGVAIAFVMLASACTSSSTQKDETEWKPAKAGNFTLNVPAHLREASELNDEAVIQYQNPVKEFYCIVLEDGQNEFHKAVEVNSLTDQYPLTLDGYVKLIGDTFAENVEEIYTKSEAKPIGINGREGRYFEVEARVAGLDIYYHYGFVKGDTTYYQILTWTLRDRKTKYADDMLNILESFKEN